MHALADTVFARKPECPPPPPPPPPPPGGCRASPRHARYHQEREIAIRGLPPEHDSTDQIACKCGLASASLRPAWGKAAALILKIEKSP